MRDKRDALNGFLGMAVICAVLTISLPAPAQTYTVINTFSGSNGAQPLSGLIFDKLGNLYGTTSAGGLGGGVVFRLSKSGNTWTETVLYEFGSHAKDGSYPMGRLIIDGNGNLYGTTYLGGANNAGTIYQLKRNGTSYTESVVHHFGGGNDGANPTSGLVADAAGNGYGTTYYGGTNKNCAAFGGVFSCGTVYQISAKNGTTYNVIHNFAGGADGAFPWSDLTLDSSGHLFGECVYGSQYGKGLLYELGLSGGQWVEKPIHPWGNKDDGTYIYGGVTFDAAGNMFGVSSGGGAHGGQGTVFEFTPNGDGFLEHNLHGFGTALDGQFPEGNLMVDANDNLFGVTHGGGAYGYGMVYAISFMQNNWIEKVLHDFTGGNDGATTFATLVMDASGNLYGTTTYGGSARGCGTGPIPGCGVVFQITGTGGKPRQ